MTDVIFKKGDIVRRVHPEAYSTQRLLKKAGFIQVAHESADETAVSPPDDPFAFLPEKAAKALVEAGIHNLEDLAAADAETLLAIDGIGNATLEKILEAVS